MQKAGKDGKYERKIIMTVKTHVLKEASVMLYSLYCIRKYFAKQNILVCLLYLIADSRI